MSVLYETLRLRHWIDRKDILRWAGIALAVSIPLSTTATGIAGAAVLILFCFRGDFQKLRWHWHAPAVVASALLLALFPLGALWSHASAALMLDHAGQYIKVLLIPVLVLVLARGDWPRRVLLAFAGGVFALLTLSVLHYVLPDAGFWWDVRDERGVPIRSTCSGLVAYALALKALTDWRGDRRRMVAGLAAAAALAAWSLFAVPSRTGTLVILMLFGLLWVQLLGWRGAIAGAFAGMLVAGALYVASPNMRAQFDVIAPQVAETQASGAATSSGVRITLWRLGLAFVAEKPLLGHGTGSVLGLYEEAMSGTDYAFRGADDPHNQYLAMAIPFGGLGLVVLFTFWGLHLYALWGSGFYHRLGQAVVAQNVLSGLFNSYLYTFAPGWMYVLLVSACIAAIWIQERRAQLRP